MSVSIRFTWDTGGEHQRPIKNFIRDIRKRYGDVGLFVNVNKELALYNGSHGFMNGYFGFTFETPEDLTYFILKYS